MQTYHLRCELVTECPLLETFEFFKNPLNLAKITPSWLNFQVLTQDVAIRSGAEIEYNIRWLGLPMHWKTLIAEYEPPYYFVDEQAEGPYSLWRHRHTFEAVSAGASTPSGTKVGDHVEYALPLGKLGQIAHAVMVKKQLQAIFRFRQRQIGNLLGAKTVEVTAPVITAGR
jgi:ligand-binding SRPBCC domain-containing protein